MPAQTRSRQRREASIDSDRNSKSLQRKTAKKRKSNRKSLEPSSSVMVALDNPKGIRWIMEFAPIYASILHGIEKGLRSVNKQLRVCSVRSKEEFEGLVKSLPPSGFLFLASKNVLSFRELIGSIPCVSVLGASCEGFFDQVSYDNLATGRMAADFFVNQGIDRAAILGPAEPGRSSTFGQRLHSFTETMEDRGGSVVPLLSDELYAPGNPSNDPRPEEIRRLVGTLLQADPLPRGLFVMAENILPAVHSNLLESGIIPGQDLQIISCNSESLCGSGYYAENASVTIPSEEIGIRAVEILDWRSKNPARRPSITLFPPVLQLAGASKTIA